MSPSPKAVVFDLGKVLLDFAYAIAARKLISNGKLKLTELARLFAAPADILMRYETGLINTGEFYTQICAVTGYSRGFEEFSSCFGDIFTPIDEIVQAHEKIRARGIPTYIFSNTNELAIQHIRRTYPFFENFTGYILSYEHRAMKPDQALYEVVERVSGKTGNELLYIDDRAENIATGKARGWQTILQENPARTVELLMASGVL
jgi:2-haloacid dehalogenase